MDNKIKFWIVCILLLFCVVLSFAIPKETKYAGTKFISQLKLPHIITGWAGNDVSAKLNINYQEEEFNFINEALAYNYENKYGETLLFLILDAGNFHYPNVCLTNAGFKVRELKKTALYTSSNRMLNAHTIYIEKANKDENFLILYWIVIDKKPVPEWIEQKVKQLYFSLFNKKRVGLMMRLDIPIKKNNIEDGLILAKQFINDLSQALPPEQADFIFGNDLHR